MKAWQLMLHLMRYRPALYGFGVFVWSIFFMWPLVPGLINRAIFDQLSGAAPAVFGIWTLVALLVTSELSRRLLTQLGTAMDIAVQYNIAGLLRKNMLKRILAQPGAQALYESSSSAINSFRDDVEEILTFSVWLLDVLGHVLFSVIAVGILLNIDLRITLVILIPLLIVVSAFTIANQRIQRFRKASRAATSNVSNFLGELFGSIQTIKVTNAESAVVAHFQQLNDQRRQVMVKDRVFTALLNSVYATTISLGTGMILLLAGEAMRTGNFSVGDFSLFVYYFAMVTRLPSLIGLLLTHSKQAGVSFQRMQSLLNDAPAAALVEHGPIAPDSPADFSPPSVLPSLQRLTLQDLNYCYPQSQAGVQAINFSIKRGQFVVITGKIGAGKTTLLRALLGLVPASGTIIWNDQAIAHPAEQLIPPNCAYTPQVPRLFSGSLHENISLGLNLDEMQRAQAIKTSMLEADLASMPAGFATELGARGVRLSGGQLQRTALARMLVRQSQLMVVDDCSSALDATTERQLWQALRQLPSTWLVVSHRRSLLQLADWVIVLDAGRITAQGRLDELLQTSPVMQELWRTEAPNEAA
ncbi:ABC transporter ATP-binding protein [Herpetosiphon giganteus]|uniref:ABC transporter ATP-binding protein n=1 Tax=Herpetosiphon giganteus TaxID=2029754 RepID=UPI00195F0008|nr:ABC transporter ATP-binding protein [Herpetosiphon giganteus]MBM7844627.1 ATP-binding cassette subfamily B protein [Herpetosiphon giganteus]